MLVIFPTTPIAVLFLWMDATLLLTTLVQIIKCPFRLLPKWSSNMCQFVPIIIQSAKIIRKSFWIDSAAENHLQNEGDEIDKGENEQNQNYSSQADWHNEKGEDQCDEKWNRYEKENDPSRKGPLTPNIGRVNGDGGPYEKRTDVLEIIGDCDWNIHYFMKRFGEAKSCKIKIKKFNSNYLNVFDSLLRIRFSMGTNGCCSSSAL